jgi:hypothetical protein
VHAGAPPLSRAIGKGVMPLGSIVLGVRLERGEWLGVLRGVSSSPGEASEMTDRLEGRVHLFIVGNCYGRRENQAEI